VTYETVLEAYSLEEILAINDITPEEALEFMVKSEYITLPEIQPLEFDD
jgi:hypothetical protein